MSLTNFNKVITWNDFTKVPSRPWGKSEDAVISASWDIDASFGRKGNAIVIEKYTVNIFLIPEKCTALNTSVVAANAAYILKHEQGHYDIIALGAREFHDKVGKLSADTEVELNTKINDLKTKISDDTDIVDERYDTATNHSMNIAVQQAWDLKISAAKRNLKGTIKDLP